MAILDKKWRRHRSSHGHVPLGHLVAFGLLLIALTPRAAQAYIGPGAGFAVAGSVLVLLTTLLSGVAALFFWPFRYTLRAIRGRKAYRDSRIRRCIVVGLDGMDPELTGAMIDRGRLPNLARMTQQGSFSRLASTIPPISPVAWSSFQTASNPGKHAIFDFLTPDPKTYQPKLSSVEISPLPRRFKIARRWLRGTSIRLLRKGRPFWHVLADHGVFANILRVPITFPPEKFGGLSLSAMCVPDLRGSQGTFSYYTSDNQHEEHTGGQSLPLQSDGTAWRGELIGPDHPFRPEQGPLKVPFSLQANGSTAELRIGRDKTRLQQGQYSAYLTVSFRVRMGLTIHGICRFLLLSTTPHVRLYVTPIQIDPAKPAMPLSHPRAYATYFAKRQGPYATLGLAEDTWALNEGVLEDVTFLAQAQDIHQEREKMFFDALDKLPRGLGVCVFDGTDRLQHTCWRYIDPEHPAHDTCRAELGNPIEDMYTDCDRIVGRVLDRYDDAETLILVISDHGFGPFRYGVDLNRWLEENGYLVVRPNGYENKYLTGVDMSKSKAFAVGLAGIYLNIHGRFAQGIVEPGHETQELAAEIAERLGGLRHAALDQPAIRRVYLGQETYVGPYKNQMPDLVVGYHKGYRASWQTAVGHVTEQVFHANGKAWSGDHCVDRDLVPGVLFSNRPIRSAQPRLIDIGPTILHMFGVKTPKYMDGRVLEVELNGNKRPQTGQRHDRPLEDVEERVE